MPNADHATRAGLFAGGKVMPVIDRTDTLAETPATGGYAMVVHTHGQGRDSRMSQGSRCDSGLLGRYHGRDQGGRPRSAPQ